MKLSFAPVVVASLFCYVSLTLACGRSTESSTASSSGQSDAVEVMNDVTNVPMDEKSEKQQQEQSEVLSKPQIIVLHSMGSENSELTDTGKVMVCEYTHQNKVVLGKESCKILVKEPVSIKAFLDTYADDLKLIENKESNQRLDNLMLKIGTVLTIGYFIAKGPKTLAAIDYLPAMHAEKWIGRALVAFAAMQPGLWALERFEAGSQQADSEIPDAEAPKTTVVEGNTFIIVSMVPEQNGESFLTYIQEIAQKTQLQ